MFKLVGEDTFYIDSARCIIRVDPAPGFKYEYLLFIDGKSHDQYTEETTKQYRLWLTTINGVEYRIMLELDTLNLYINDQLRKETVSEVTTCQNQFSYVGQRKKNKNSCRLSSYKATDIRDNILSSRYARIC